MKLRTVFSPLLFLGMCIAQDSTPIDLSGKDHAPICRGKDSDVPGCITAPHATYSPDPDYPRKGRDGRKGGTVVLSAVVGSDGLPRDLSVTHSLSPGFDQSAIDAVNRWKFSPATKDGKPIATQIKVEIDFRVR